MHMDWSHQLQVTIEALKSMLKGIKASNAKVYQKMRTIKSCIRSKVRYTFCVAPYSDKDIHNIDSLISRACKSAHGLPLYIARAFVHEDIDKGGLGCPSMQVEYKEVALQRLVAALNDHGPLGEISRARMDQDHHCLDHMTAKLHPVLAKHSLRLRQQIACADLRLTIMRHGQPMYCLPEPAELLGQITSVQNQLQNSVPPLLRRDIQRLCKVGITSLQHLLTPTGRQLMPLKALQRKLGKKLTTTEQAAHKRVCHMLRQAPGISTQDYKSSMTQGTNTHSHTVHPDHVRTLQALEVVDTADARGAPLWSLAAIQQQPHLTRDTISELQTYIQNMRCRNKCAPTSIRRQLEDAPQQIRTNTRAATGYMTYQKLTAIQPLTTAQERQLEQLYIRYAADVDQIDAIVGVAKAAQHRKIKGQRERTAQQDQVVVRWKPTLMQGWVAEIAQNILKYRIAHARAATTEEIMDDTQNSVVECCSRLPECKRPSLHDTTAIVCDTCHRAYHIECLPPEAKSHAQNALEDNQRWHCNECTHHQWTEDSLPKEVRHLLITWEDSSEDKETLMTSSGWEDAWAVYTSRCGEEPHAPVGETQTHASQNQLAKAQQQLPSLQQQGDYYPNHSTRYNITIGQECRHKLHVHTEAINPHTDIEPTGQHEVYIRTILMRCNERNEEHELACIYTPDGRCRFTLTVERAAILYQQYKRVQEAKPKLVKRLQGGSFAKELYALMCRYKDVATIDSKTHSKIKLANHWATPEEIYRVIQRHTQTSHERFASPLNWSPEFANYYSIHKRDQLFGARWNTYRYKWTEAGVHNPEYEDQDLNKNIATAVAATQYTSEPVFGIHILPAWTDSNKTAYMRWMELYSENCRHILQIPRKHFRFERPTEWCMGERFAKNPRWDVNIVVTGNQAGFKKHFPHWDKEYMDKFMEDLQQAVNETLPLDKHINQIQDFCPQAVHATNHPPTKSELKILASILSTLDAVPNWVPWRDSIQQTQM